MAALGWSDAGAIAERLHARLPDRDPLTLRFPDLERWVAALEDFAPGAGPPEPRQLEAIQRAWYERFRGAVCPPGPRVT